MGKKKEPAGTKALQVLQASGFSYEVIEYAHSEHQDHGYALDTAKVLGRNPATIFKTLMAQVDGLPVCAIVPATVKLNLKSLAKALGGKKAGMLEPSAAERLTGYVTGGISPLGQRCTVPTVIDNSALEHQCISVSGGRRTLSVDLAPGDLAELTSASFASITVASGGAVS